MYARLVSGFFLTLSCCSFCCQYSVAVSNDLHARAKSPSKKRVVAAALLAKNQALKVARTPGMGNRFAFVAHTDKDPYTNKDLMLALKHGIDRQQIVKNVFSGYATVGNDHTVGPRMKPVIWASIPNCSMTSVSAATT